jgi:hypothetical protein
LQGQNVEVAQLGTGQTEICGRKYATASRRIVIHSDATQSISTVEYSDTVAPYFLKRTTEAIDNETKTRNYRSDVEVLAVDMPAKVLSEIKTAAHVKTIEAFGNGANKVTLEVHCAAVPGGVVSHTSKQVGPDQRITRSTLELVDYEAIMKAPVGKRPPATSRRRLFKGKRRN